MGREMGGGIAVGVGDSRDVHRVIENDRNEAHFLDRERGPPVSAQWNDDWHHAAHVLLTGEKDGYYADYAKRPAWQLARCLAEGFAYQSDPSGYRKGEARAEPSSQLPFDAFVPFLQNHDQAGNRALGDRLAPPAPPPALKPATARPALPPPPPLLFRAGRVGAR